MNNSLKSRLDSMGKIAEIKRILATLNPTPHTGIPECYVVTSGDPKEGKTTLCAGLSLAASEQQSLKVLAIDCNWHTPALHDFFDVDVYTSFDEIDPHKPLKDMVRSTWLDNLDILPAVFFSRDAKPVNVTGWSMDILQKARSDYDVIFIDTSSIYPTNHRMMDPIILSKQASGVVLVTLTNVTPKQTLKRASTMIQTQGANLLGVVANQWKNPIT